MCEYHHISICRIVDVGNATRQTIDRGINLSQSVS